MEKSETSINPNPRNILNFGLDIQSKLRRFLTTINPTLMLKMENFLGSKPKDFQRCESFQLHHDIFYIYHCKKNERKIEIDRFAFHQLCIYFKQVTHFSVQSIRQRIIKKLAQLKPLQITNHLRQDMLIRFRHGTRQQKQIKSEEKRSLSADHCQTQVDPRRNLSQNKNSNRCQQIKRADCKVRVVQLRKNQQFTITQWIFALADENEHQSHTKDFLENIRKKINVSQNLNNLGVFIYYQGHDYACQSFFNQSIKEDKDNFYPVFNLGALYLERQEKKKAFEYFTAAQKLKPNFEIRLKIATAYYSLGQFESAYRLLSNLQDQQPENTMVKTYLKSATKKYQASLIQFGRPR